MSNVIDFPQSRLFLPLENAAAPARDPSAEALPTEGGVLIALPSPSSRPASGPPAPVPPAAQSNAEAPANGVLEDAPHITGQARCLDCQHTWQVVAPAGTIVYECPACGTMRGVLHNIVGGDPDELHFMCVCGSLVFSITPQRIYCISCGKSHRPFD